MGITEFSNRFPGFFFEHTCQYPNIVLLYRYEKKDFTLPARCRK